MHAHVYAIAQTDSMQFGCSITLLTRLEMRRAALLLPLVFAFLVARVPQILHACTLVCYCTDRVWLQYHTWAD